MRYKLDERVGMKRKLLIKYLGFATLFFASTTALSETALLTFDENSLRKGEVIFQRGVFRVAKDGKVEALCIPVQGKWKHVGDKSDCGNKPPKEVQREIVSFPTDETYLGTRNLGVSLDEWQQSMSSDMSSTAGKLHKTFSYSVNQDSVSWGFNSKELPQEFKVEIPGSGIHTHFGGRFSEKNYIPVLQTDKGELMVKFGLAVPTFIKSGKGHSGVTIAVDLEVPTVSGGMVTVPVVSNIFHPNLGGREGVASDGRVTYVNARFRGDSNFITWHSGSAKKTPWDGVEEFSFGITRNNLQQIINEANLGRAKEGEPLFDVKQLERVMISGLNLRNESRFLEQGDVMIKVVVDYLTLSR